MDVLKRPAQQARNCRRLLLQNREIWTIFKEFRRTNPRSSVLAHAISSVPRSSAGRDLSLAFKKELAAHQRLWQYLAALDEAAKAYGWDDYVISRLPLLEAWRKKSDLAEDQFFAAFAEHEQVLSSLASIKGAWGRTAAKWASFVGSRLRMPWTRTKAYLERRRAATALNRLCSPCCGAPRRPSMHRKGLDALFRLAGFYPYRCTACRRRFYRFGSAPEHHD